jgi:hypothetical protein
VDKFLWRGGISEVYRVFDLEREAPLAMKMLYPDLAYDRVFMKYFRGGEKEIIKLQPPNIVSL